MGGTGRHKHRAGARRSRGRSAGAAPVERNRTGELPVVGRAGQITHHQPPVAHLQVERKVVDPLWVVEERLDVDPTLHGNGREGDVPVELFGEDLGRPAIDCRAGQRGRKELRVVDVGAGLLRIQLGEIETVGREREVDRHRRVLLRQPLRDRKEVADGRPELHALLPGVDGGPIHLDAGAGELNGGVGHLHRVAE
ncbi:MAG: hypothetical protein BRD30_06710 [Bacteroidetes bacterium QH_2_63_10]|nr:MAG: hypothetical protein BRD30_06710 [Bacteroidetes bacterium QH_2_63_10]